MNRLPDAIKYLKRILKAEPETIEAHVDLGIAYTAQGFYVEAERSLEKALELDKNDFATRYHLAALYAIWEQPERAIEQLEAASGVDHSKLKLWARDDQAFRLVTDPAHRTEIDCDHHREDHRPDEHGNDEIAPRE